MTKRTIAAFSAALICAHCAHAEDGRNAASAAATITIIPASPAAPISLAAEELAKYLRVMTGKAVQVLPALASSAKLDSDAPRAQGIRIGVAADFPTITLPKVADPELDDAIHVDVQDGSGVIAGTNPRAALLGVYRYLTALGCRWVRPGPDGEFIPSSPTLRPVSIHEAASYRHRGICIEGANSAEHIQTLIDWMPKLGFNSYFIQFDQGYFFFDQWYSRDRPNQKGFHPTVEQANGYVAKIEPEIKKRGMLYHKVGHGWTCMPFGVQALGWQKAKEPPAPEIVPLLRQMGGVRGYDGGEPLCTNLCYSNPEARRRMRDYIVDYAQKHSAVDYLHVWLADGWDNHCECDACRKMRPSDWYVTLLNELDAALSERGLKTRIVFLIYVDLLWPPEHGRITHPDRFVLMFAPYTRTYDQAYRAEKVSSDLPPFTLNKLKMPETADGNVAFLQAWKKMFKGDSFDYDYHIFAQHENLGQMQLARVLYDDMKNLKDLGLNGNVSCQPQRVFFPTGVLMTIMGRTLWNREANFDEIVDDYFKSAFGADGSACRQYVDQLTSLYHAPVVHDRDAEPVKLAADMKGVLEHLGKFEPTITRNSSLSNPCQARSWQILRSHTELSRRYVNAVLAREDGKKDAAAAAWKDAETFAWDHESDLQIVFDVSSFVDTMQGLFVEKKKE
ncbi:MAG: DUF4838 domain-containing protein [Candidatus Hydrogenedentes bacterium]|nr:DUF4838 domain-containing protein [Candidatus Hydrogenedentota bacterium]